MVFALNNAAAGTRRLILTRSLRVSRLQGMRVPRSYLALLAFSLWGTLFVGVTQAQNTQNTGILPAPFAGATISEWKGEVHVQLPAAKMYSPKRGQVLPAGTVVETGEGRLVLVLRTDESEILVQPHTRLLVSEPVPGNWNAVEILVGRVRAYIRKRTGGAPPFQMGTPSAVIAVRGTRFDVEVNRRGVSEIDVFDGLVEVASSTVSAASVLVSPGFSTRVGMGTPPENPVPTEEIRPGVEVPDEMAKAEFARERAAQSDRPFESELGERPDAELDESVDESREPEKK